MAPVVGLRERKKQRTREQLQHAALALFAERGIDQVTVEEIAERADVSRSTFFRYFRTKEEVLVARADELFEELIGAFAARPDGEPVLRSLRESLRPLAEGYEDRRAEFLVMRDVAAHHPDVRARALEHQAAWEAAFAEQLAARMAGEAVGRRARVVAGAVIAAVRVAVEEWVAADGRLDLVAVIDDALDVLDGGLGTALAG